MSASPYTFEGAREALLGKSSAALKAVDALLGISLVAAGSIGVATGHPWVLAAWGWIDQKNELVARLNDLVTGGRTGLAKATGVRRHRLLSATHTALVAASFFAVLREELGPVFEELALTGEEQRRLVVGTDGGTLYAEAVSHLVTDEVGLPWAGRGLDRNIEEQVRPYLARLTQRTFAFFDGLAAWTDRFGTVDRRRSRRDLTTGAVERYRAEYLNAGAVAAVSERLVRGALSRWDKGRFADYDPSKRPNVQRVGVYTANLVIIRLAVAGETPVPVARFCPSGSDVAEWGPMIVGLWRAALPSSDLSALLDLLGIHEDLERARRLRPPARS